MGIDEHQPGPIPSRETGIGEPAHGTQGTLPEGAFWHGKGLYVVGALLVYVGGSWSLAVSYSTIPEIQLTVGLVLGPVASTPLAIVHWWAQWLVRVLVRRFVRLRTWPEIVALNLPVTALMCAWVIGAYRFNAAAPAFERFVAKPLPSSVRLIGYGGGKMNISEGDRAGIWFEIDPPQLKELIGSGGFELAADEHGPEYWKRLFRHFAHLEVPLDTPYTLYRRESQPRTNEMSFTFAGEDRAAREVVKSVSYEAKEYLFCASNRPSVFYLRLAR